MKKTIKIRHLTSILFFISLTLTCTFCHQEHKETIIIGAAANMQLAIAEISDAFTAQTGIPCTLIISSSGKHTAQIKEGAPYDIFVSANMKYPDEIYKNGFAIAPPKLYAYGQLVLWSMTENTKPTIAILTDKNIRHIAIANPKTAPYGEAAIQVLKHWQIYDSIADKLVYGESIAQTNQFIMSTAAEIGFTAKSIVLSPKMKEKGHWTPLNINIASIVC